MLALPPAVACVLALAAAGVGALNAQTGNAEARIQAHRHELASDSAHSISYARQNLTASLTDKLFIRGDAAALPDMLARAFEEMGLRKCYNRVSFYGQRGSEHWPAFEPWLRNTSLHRVAINVKRHVSVKFAPVGRAAKDDGSLLFLKEGGAEAWHHYTERLDSEAKLSETNKPLVVIQVTKEREDDGVVEPPDEVYEDDYEPPSLTTAPVIVDDVENDSSEEQYDWEENDFSADDGPLYLAENDFLGRGKGKGKSKGKSKSKGKYKQRRKW
mmetsp:Transcript_67630/g.207160  ORF Transcript_67630/g.207160 Transcript_67630/m.207160 type:complete len:272 (-) Transcript_67630:88-903(-)